MCASSRPSPSIVIHTPTVCHARCASICCIAPGTRTYAADAQRLGEQCPGLSLSYASLGPPRTTLRHPSIHDSSVSAPVSLRYNGRRTAAYLDTHSIYPFPPVRPSQRPHPPKCAARSWGATIRRAPSFPPYSAADLMYLEPQHPSANFHLSLCHYQHPAALSVARMFPLGGCWEHA